MWETTTAAYRQRKGDTGHNGKRTRRLSVVLLRAPRMTCVQRLLYLVAGSPTPREPLCDATRGQTRLQTGRKINRRRHETNNIMYRAALIY